MKRKKDKGEKGKHQKVNNPLEVVFTSNYCCCYYSKF